MLIVAVLLGLLGLVVGLVAIPLFAIMGALSARRPGSRSTVTWALGAVSVLASPIVVWLLLSAVPVLQFWERTPTGGFEREGNLGDVFAVFVVVIGLPMLVAVVATLATVRWRTRPQAEGVGVDAGSWRSDRPLFEP